MKKERTKDLLLEQVRKIPIIQVACEKIGIARATVYRWKAEDEQFRTQLEEVLAEGEALINDMGESQLLSLMKEKSWPAISFWLRHRNPKFRERLEVTTNVKTQDALSEEQQAIVQEALRLASLTQDAKAKEDAHELKKENNEQA
ncbi:MAG: hypothetical protein COT25_02815 [Candidatus Kerfeldbacteria bacterium CG08_land_8_20_14_0_20_42_7]|uniref:Homeodomain phBC6A51-type domain-containing protein n=1 Tax=Candidatus Kerfeldbacteria bacterium CG08_land_8_20_14_0_20_42_7 TaxID=2014245 RepID=A0A2H0YUS9_9BACT|nr:MAG: hypothetical protein COT25_02815 [Candidatus Kerfeldbacteria bacterium CG08_land_8_20_14_0_20_42_7]